MNKKTNIKTKRKKITVVNILLVTFFIMLIILAGYKNKDAIIKLIIGNNINQKASNIPSTMKIGDKVNYNHKVAADGDQSKLITTLKAGNAKVPGTGNTERDWEISGMQPDQVYNAANTDIEWIVWDIDKATGSVTLISKDVLPQINTGGAVGHIWWEHNANQLASIFGHGIGADKKQISYKVGSGVIGVGDTATWKTGQSNEGQVGIPLSGAWSLTLPEVEEKLNIPANKSNADTVDSIMSYRLAYGNSNRISVEIPLRDVGQANSNWKDKANAVGVKKSYGRFKNDDYIYIQPNELFSNNPYRDIIFRIICICN